MFDENKKWSCEKEKGDSLVWAKFIVHESTSDVVGEHASSKAEEKHGTGAAAAINEEQVANTPSLAISAVVDMTGIPLVTPIQ